MPKNEILIIVSQSDVRFDEKGLAVPALYSTLVLKMWAI
ncbi:hypothetical protein ABH892_001865 [Paenibacillus sp. RC254]